MGGREVEHRRAVDGGPAADRLDPEEVLRVGRQAGQGVAHGGGRGTGHRRLGGRHRGGAGACRRDGGRCLVAEGDRGRGVVLVVDCAVEGGTRGRDATRRDGGGGRGRQGRECLHCAVGGEGAAGADRLDPVEVLGVGGQAGQGVAHGGCRGTGRRCRGGRHRGGAGACRRDGRRCLVAEGDRARGVVLVVDCAVEGGSGGRDAGRRCGCGERGSVRGREVEHRRAVDGGPAADRLDPEEVLRVGRQAGQGVASRGWPRNRSPATGWPSPRWRRCMSMRWWSLPCSRR